MFMVESTGEDRCRTKKPEAAVAARGVSVAVGASRIAAPASPSTAAAAQAASKWDTTTTDDDAKGYVSLVLANGFLSFFAAS